MFAQIVSLALAAALAVTFWGLDRSAASRALLWSLHVLLLASAGFGTGVVFPSAGNELLSVETGAMKDDASHIAVSLELWDHIGAAVSALLGAVLVIPTFGLQRSACLLLVLQLLALCVTWISSRRPNMVRTDNVST